MTGFTRGDANSDGAVDIGDAIMLLAHLFASGTGPECEDAADANDDGGIDVSDAITILSTLFGGHGVLEPRCGPDPTPDLLTCFTSVACPDS